MNPEMSFLIQSCYHNCGDYYANIGVFAGKQCVAYQNVVFEQSKTVFKGTTSHTKKSDRQTAVDFIVENIDEVKKAVKELSGEA